MSAISGLRRILPWLGLTLVVGCNDPVDPGEPRQLVLRPGETRRIEDLSIEISLEGVHGDSRCPIDAVCVWAGDATLKLWLRSPRALGRQSFDLSVASDSPAGGPVEIVAGIRVELLELAPQPRTTVVIRPSDYRATLQLSAADS